MYYWIWCKHVSNVVNFRYPIVNLKSPKKKIQDLSQPYNWDKQKHLTLLLFPRREKTPSTFAHKRKIGPSNRIQKKENLQIQNLKIQNFQIQNIQILKNMTRGEKLALLAEYRGLLAEALLIGNKALVASIKTRISMLEHSLFRQG